MLIGKTLSTIDDKKRLTIPFRLRNSFVDNTIIISRGFEGCLVLRSLTEFESWQNKILAQSEGLKSSRILARQIFANSEKVLIDNKGRVTISLDLLQLAQITKNVIVLGLINKIEIWAETLWEKFNEETIDQLEVVASSLNDL